MSHILISKHQFINKDVLFTEINLIKLFNYNLNNSII